MFLELPETKPSRVYIDGNIYKKISPKVKHSLGGLITEKITINLEHLPDNLFVDN